MSKKSGKHYIEVQKGPIEMIDRETTTQRMTREDIRENSMRVYGQNLVKHEPKR